MDNLLQAGSDIPVGAGELMKEEQHYCQEESLEIASVGEDILQDCHDTIPAMGFLLDLDLGFDFSVFCLDVPVLAGKLAKRGQVLEALLFSPGADKVSRGLRHEWDHEAPSTCQHSFV